MHGSWHRISLTPNQSRVLRKHIERKVEHETSESRYENVLILESINERSSKLAIEIIVFVCWVFIEQKAIDFYTQQVENWF